MHVYVLMANRLPIGNIAVLRTTDFPSDGPGLRALCQAEEIHLGNPHSFAITYEDFLRDNNNGYAIDDIPLVIFDGHASIEETLRDHNAIPLTSQIYQRPELLTRRRARSLVAPDAVDRRRSRSAEGP